jgi:glycosyltransferase involved in cell wall biosynthesis
MRVALVVPGFASSHDDPCIPVLRDVVRALASHVDVHVFALRYPHRPRTYRLDGITVHPLGGGDLRGVRRLPFLWRAVQAIREQHAATPFEAVHGVWLDEPGAVAVAAARSIGVTSVASLMGGELVAFHDIRYGGALSWLNRRLSRWSIRHVRHITAGSLAGTAAITAAGRSAMLLPWGIDPTLFSPQGPRMDLRGDTRILHVGSLVPVKDHALLFDVLARGRSASRDVQLHVVGDGSLRGELERLAVRAGVREAVTFHGFVPREGLGAYYRASDVVAVTSRHEMQPVVVLEAAACGLRSAGVATGLLPDLAPDLTAVATHRDPDDIARVLLSVAGDSTRRTVRGQVTPSLLQHAHTARATAEKLLELYGCRVGATRRATAAAVTHSV